MAQPFSTQVKGLEELHRKLDDGIPKAVRRDIFQLRGSALKKAKEEAKPHAGDTGALAESIKASVTLTAAIPFKLRVFTAAPIATEVEEGRKGTHMTAGQALRFKRRHPGVSLTVRQLVKLPRTKGVQFMEKTGVASLDTYIPEFVDKAERTTKAEWDK